MSKAYVLVEVDIPDEDRDEITPTTWMSATLETARLNAAPSLKPGDTVPPHPYRPRVIGEVTDPLVVIACKKETG